MSAEKLGGEKVKLQKEIVHKEGKVLMDDLFNKLLEFNEFKLATADAWLEESRVLRFWLNNIEHELDVRTINKSTKKAILRIGRDSTDRKKISIAVTSGYPEGPNNEIQYQEYKDGKPVIDETDTQDAVNFAKIAIIGMKKIELSR